MSTKLKMKLLPVAFRLSTNYLSWTGALIPWSIIILKTCDNIGNKYNSVSHM